jgi:hypothetical protein
MLRRPGAGRALRSRRQSVMSVSLQHVAGWLLALLVLLWRASCRRVVRDDPRPALRAAGRPYVYALLHAHQVGAVLVNDDPGIAAMVSASKDGDLLVPSLRVTGVRAMRGSSRRADRDKGGTARPRAARGAHPPRASEPARGRRAAGAAEPRASRRHPPGSVPRGRDHPGGHHPVAPLGPAAHVGPLPDPAALQPPDDGLRAARGSADGAGRGAHARSGACSARRAGAALGSRRGGAREHAPQRDRAPRGDAAARLQ